jgi:hypothetical protein
MRMRWAIAIACATAATRVASASPDSDPTLGRAVFSGAATSGPAALALNPAALGLGTATGELAFAASAVLDTYSIGLSSIDLATGALTPGAAVHDTELGAGAGGTFIYRPDPRVALAIEVRRTLPEMYPGPQDALRYHTLGGRQYSYVGSAGVSVRVVGGWIVGAGVTYDSTYLHFSYARDTALENGHGPNGVDSSCGGAPCGLGNPLAAERYDVSVGPRTLVSTDQFVLTVGSVFQLAPATWLGIAYHSPPGLSLQSELSGSMTVTRAPRDGGGIVQGGATVYVSLPAIVDAELRSRLVQNLELHVGGRWVNLSREHYYDVRGYGALFAQANIPEWTERALQYSDPISVWAGVEQVETSTEHFSDRLRFGGRIGFETHSVINDRTSPMAIAPFSLTFDAGAQLRPSRGSGVLFELTYGLQYFVPVHVTQSAFDPRQRIACIESGFDYSTTACAATRLGYAIDTAAGDYQRVEHALRAAVRIQWK